MAADTDDDEKAIAAETDTESNPSRQGQQQQPYDEESYIAQAEALWKQDRAKADQGQPKTSNDDASPLHQNVAFAVCGKLDDITDELVRVLYREIQRLSTNKPTYDLAHMGLCSKFIHRRDFLAKFLRADRYDPKEAAKRLNGFLDACLEYFGPEALTRPVRMNDLTPIEMDLVRTGAFQVLPGRDHVGSRIGFRYAMDPPEGATETNVARVAFYCMQCLAEDEMTQSVGLVLVDFVPHEYNLLQGISHLQASYQVIAAMPVRISSIHFGIPTDMWSRSLQATLLMELGRTFRQSVTFHIGTPSAIQKTLASDHGITSEMLPFMYDGKIKLKIHTKWINIRMTLEDWQNRDPIAFDKACQDGLVIECPHSTDVLGGKGQVIQSFPGNLSMRQLLEETIDEYNTAPNRNEKSIIIGRIVHAIQGNGQSDAQPRRQPGRFLKEHSSGLWWVQMTHKEALTKISMAFRDVRKKIAAERDARPKRKGDNDEGAEGVTETATVAGLAAIVTGTMLPHSSPPGGKGDQSNLPPR